MGYTFVIGLSGHTHTHTHTHERERETRAKKKTGACEYLSASFA